MEKVDIKIGKNTYSGVSIINVDKADGGTADFVYGGITDPYIIIGTFTNYNVTSKGTFNEPKITTSIEQGG